MKGKWKYSVAVSNEMRVKRKNLDLINAEKNKVKIQQYCKHLSVDGNMISSLTRKSFIICISTFHLK